MPASIRCSCGKTLSIPDSFSGTRARCPECQTMHDVPNQSDRESLDKYSIEEFAKRTGERNRGQGMFELESDRLLEINLNGSVWTKKGSMVCYRGDVHFEREGILEHGLGKLMKKMVSGEGIQLTRAQGKGKVYLADGGKKVTVLHLTDDTLFVNGNDVLAFEEQVEWDIKMMRKIAGMMAGGLFNIRLSGTGRIALTSHHDPVTLKVTPDSPVITDPNATVAWSGSLEPEIRTDISLKSFFGRGSGESIQMQFRGNGFVVVQPYEESYFQHGQ